MTRQQHNSIRELKEEKKRAFRQFSKNKSQENRYLYELATTELNEAICKYKYA
jgi:hypothetical protein